MRKVIALITVIVVLVALGISGCSFGIAQAPTATPTPTRTPKPTFTPLVTETPTAEATPTATNTPVVAPTDMPTPAPSPTAMPTATDTPVPPPTATSPPPTATPTNTPTPEVKPCSYVDGSKEAGAAGGPGLGLQPSSIFEGYLYDAADNPLNNHGVEFEHPSVGTFCVVTGDPAPEHVWAPGFWKHEFWAALGTETTYYLTIKESCAPGARAFSIKENFSYKYWGSGHHHNIIFVCSF